MNQDRFVKLMLAAIVVLLIASVLLQISRPALAAAQGRRTYLVIYMGGGPTNKDIEKALNEYARDGWHLVAVQDAFLYLEK